MGYKNRQPHISRLLALVLCLLLVFATLPGRACALSGTTGELSWSLSAGTLRISGSGPMPNYTDSTMPPWYDMTAAINRIIVEEGVTSVGNLAFYGCSTATLASLPSTVTAIGDRAFKNCTALTWISLPEGLKSIGEAAFESCEALNGVLLPESLRSIGSYAFERCTSLSSIVIPAGVTDLGMVVFYHCTGLTRAEIRCPIEKLPDWFFYGCTALSVVSLPETVVETGDQVFHDCENLDTVYYTGTAVEELSNTLQSDSATRFAEVNEGSESAGSSISAATSTFDSETATGVIVSVTQTEQAVITETTSTNYTYTVNGEVSTIVEAWSATEKDNVEVTTEKSTTVTATVSGSSGWEQVADTVRNAAVYRSDNSVDVDVQMTGSIVSGRDLVNLVGVDAELTISTGEGCVWVIQTKSQSRRDLSEEDIDLSFSVDLLEKEVKGIESDTVYQIGFASDITFNTTVGVPLKVASTRQYATLFEKSAAGLYELASVVVDENGYAWFPVESLDQGKDYFVAINEEKVDKSNAIIPDSMTADYGVDYTGTLTDASGKQYQVGERESRWGITGKQFTIYAVIVIAAIVLIVTGVMITLNKISRSKAKYAAMAEKDADDFEIDEDAIRLQVMREMLEEVRREKEDE